VVWTGNDMLTVGRCAEQGVAVEMVLVAAAKLMRVVRSDVGVLGCVSQRREHGTVSAPAGRSPNDPVVQVLTMHEGQLPLFMNNGAPWLVPTRVLSTLVLIVVGGWRR
jgi:hypothetical protein